MADKNKTIIKRLIVLALLGIAIFFSLKFVYDEAYTNFNIKDLQKNLRYSWNKLTDRGNPRTPPKPVKKVISMPQPTTTTTTTTTPPPAKRVPVANKAPFARIVIPRIGLDATVFEGTDEGALAFGPGHMEKTAWPGEDGNMVISGHRVTHTHPFYYLDELKPSDPIYIYKDSNQYIYYMTGNKVVPPTDMSVINPTGGKTLTLTTCNPRHSARTRLVVFARM